MKHLSREVADKGKQKHSGTETIPWILRATSLAAAIFICYCGDCTMRHALNSSSEINILHFRNAETTF